MIQVESRSSALPAAEQSPHSVRFRQRPRPTMGRSRARLIHLPSTLLDPALCLTQPNSDLQHRTLTILPRRGVGSPRQKFW